MTVTPQLAQLAARCYAVCAILAGTVAIAAVIFLIAVFGFHPADWTLVMAGCGPGFAFVLLGVFIWRRQTSAMIAALALLVALRYFLGDVGPVLGAALIVAPVVFAALTMIALLAPENARQA